MKAVIQTGGKQYHVSKGDKVIIERLDGDAGAQITFDQVLMVHDDASSIKIGTPYLAGAQVVGKILDQGKAKKIIVYKYKRRKGYHKKQGHRQMQTCVEIQEIRG